MSTPKIGADVCVTEPANQESCPARILMTGLSQNSERVINTKVRLQRIHNHLLGDTSEDKGVPGQAKPIDDSYTAELQYLQETEASFLFDIDDILCTLEDYFGLKDY